MKGNVDNVSTTIANPKETLSAPPRASNIKTICRNEPTGEQRPIQKMLDTIHEDGDWAHHEITIATTSESFFIGSGINFRGTTLDGLAIRNANLGDSRESIRRKNSIFNNSWRLARIASIWNLRSSRTLIQKRYARIGPSTGTTLCEALQGNLLLRGVLRGLCEGLFEGSARLCRVPRDSRWVGTLCLWPWRTVGTTSLCPTTRNRQCLSDA